jgi:hypothetical protein
MIQKLRITWPDGKTTDVVPTLEDTLAFETTLRKNRGWGGLQDSALKLQPFRAWNALRRDGKTKLSWAEFTTGKTAVLSVEVVRDDDEDDAGDDVEEAAAVGKGGRKGQPTS